MPQTIVIDIQKTLQIFVMQKETCSRKAKYGSSRCLIIFNTFMGIFMGMGGKESLGEGGKQILRQKKQDLPLNRLRIE